jgi:hypothetical protein
VRLEELADLPHGGDMLVFMPTERDITDTLDGLQRAVDDSHLLLPLFGRLPAADQRKIFRPSHRRKIIVATNVAETSVTVPGIRYVVDTGLARIARYNPRTGTTSLKVSRISQASCQQRRGRCGRTGPGTCVRLYSEEDFSVREPFTLPEIQRANLAEVILQMINLKLGDPARFPFIDAPPSTAIRDGYRTLRELGALIGEHRLTANGRLMARLPLDPRISRIIIEGMALGASPRSRSSPRRSPSRTRACGRRTRSTRRTRCTASLSTSKSDFLTLLNIWNGLFAADRGRPRARNCRATARPTSSPGSACVSGWTCTSRSAGCCANTGTPAQARQRPATTPSTSRWRAAFCATSARKKRKTPTWPPAGGRWCCSRARACTAAGRSGPWPASSSRPPSCSPAPWRPSSRTGWSGSAANCASAAGPTRTGRRRAAGCWPPSG